MQIDGQIVMAPVLELGGQREDEIANREQQRYFEMVFPVTAQDEAQQQGHQDAQADGSQHFKGYEDDREKVEAVVRQQSGGDGGA